MQVYYRENPGDGLYGLPLSFSESAVALGGFDAIHLGHQAIIRQMVKTAREQNLTAAVYLFCNQPRTVVSGEESRGIYPLKERLRFLEALGVDAVVADWFTPKLREISPEAFVKDYLKIWLGARCVAAGFDYRFGKQGSGDMNLLRTLCQKEGIGVYEQEAVSSGGVPISSTGIRQLLREGRLEEAADCLGREFSVSGRVVDGNHLGRTIGFPTANLEYPGQLILPKEGVYATRTRVDGTEYPSITHLGGRPTVTDENLRLETHLAGFSGDLYGKEITVFFRKYLRGIQKFETLEELRLQLEKDKKSAE